MAHSLSSNILMSTSTNSEKDNYSKSSTPLSTRQSHLVTKGSHEWLIEDFMKREETTGISLSTRFTTPCVDARGVNHETVWRLKAYPKGCDADHREYISIFINQVAGPVVWVKYTISLLGCHAYDRTPYVHNTRKGAVQFLADRRSSSRGWKKFIPLEQVTAPASSLLHDGALMIRCTVELESRDDRGSAIDSRLMSGISAASNRIGTDTVETRKDSISSVNSYTSSISSRDGPSGEKYSKISPQLPPFKFDSSRQQFVDSMKYTDLTLSVEPPGISNSVEIPCHKFMLAKKSDVFDAMFSHNFQETKSNRVVITDLEPDAVIEMLRYIYTNRVQSLEQVNRSLLAAADKYNIQDLKEICERSLCDSMTVENVSCLLLFARDRFSENLKRKSIDFITRNVHAVTHSPGWKELVCEPLIMTEVVRAMGPR